jgi:hypothetical protein
VELLPAVEAWPGHDLRTTRVAMDGTRQIIEMVGRQRNGAEGDLYANNSAGSLRPQDYGLALSSEVGRHE